MEKLIQEKYTHTLHIKDKKELYKCYMPFVKTGGLFVIFPAITDSISPNQDIDLMFFMLDKKDPVIVHGTVSWINYGVNKGFGVAFKNTPAMKLLKEEIESNLIDVNKKEKTYTI